MNWILNLFFQIAFSARIITIHFHLLACPTRIAQDLAHEATISLWTGSPKTLCTATRMSWGPVLLEKRQRFSRNRTGSQKVVSEWRIPHLCESNGLRKRQVMTLRGLTFSAGQTCYSERSRNHLDIASSVTERICGLFLHQAPHEGFGSQNSVSFYDRCPRVWEPTTVVIRVYAVRTSWDVHLMSRMPTAARNRFMYF